MIRNIVHIDQDKCDGCGLCVSACHEGAIGIVNGRAQLLRDDYCDGLGDCLPACPANAITIIQREAKDYDEAAVVRAIMIEPRRNLMSPCHHTAALLLKLNTLRGQFLQLLIQTTI